MLVRYGLLWLGGAIGAILAVLAGVAFQLLKGEEGGARREAVIAVVEPLLPLQLRAFVSADDTPTAVGMVVCAVAGLIMLSVLGVSARW